MEEKHGFEGVAVGLYGVSFGDRRAVCLRMTRLSQIGEWQGSVLGFNDDAGIMPEL